MERVYTFVGEESRSYISPMKGGSVTVENMRAGDWHTQWKKDDWNGTPVTFGVDHGKHEDGTPLTRAWANTPGLPRLGDVHESKDPESSNALAEQLHQKAMQSWNEHQAMEKAREVLLGIGLLKEKGTETEKRELQKLLKG